jgi:hypothetical protein
VILGLLALEVSLPTASLPAALLLVWFLIVTTWTCLVAAAHLTAGEKILPSLAKSFRLIRRSSPSALRLTAAQLGLVAFPTSVILGLLGSGSLQLLLLLPGILVLLWIWVGWMLWGLREKELYTEPPGDAAVPLALAPDSPEAVPPGTPIH